MQKSIKHLFYVAAFSAALSLASCQKQGLDQTPTISFEKANEVVDASEEVSVKVVLSKAADKDLLVPFTFSSTSSSADAYETDSASDGEEALKKLNSEHYDLVLLDVMLPKLSGIEVCQIVRETSDIPIIMLTAKGEDMDKILGLEYGADDYMTKPFNILEVKARIKSILRRAGANREAPKMELSANGLSINIGSRSATLDGKNVSLTMKEFDLLLLFMKDPGKVYSRDELLATIWGQDYLGDFRTVDVHIRRLREKIERDPANPEYILTKWGVGYYFAQ